MSRCSAASRGCVSWMMHGSQASLQCLQRNISPIPQILPASHAATPSQNKITEVIVEDGIATTPVHGRSPRTRLAGAMYIPTPASHAAAVVARGQHDNGSASGGWSSLIGIITAICGNVLISFALNTQRYAHMRLGRAREKEQERCKSERKRSRELDGIGAGATPAARQAEVAETRARKNARSRPDEDIEAAARAGAGETEPLIPKLGARKTSGSTAGTFGEDEKDDQLPAATSYLQSPVWWLGIGLMVVGEAGNFLAYGFAPASVVSPLGVVALVSNCLIAPLLLHEAFRLRDGLGVVIAVAGCVTVVLSASGSNPRLDPDDIWDLITRWEFETYLGVTVLCIIILMVASNKFGHRSVLIDLGLVGLFGGYTALSTKGVASLLSNTIWRVVTFPISYLLVAVLVFTAVMQIKYVNRALQRFNATIVIPTQFVIFTISVIVGSAVLYRDFERRSATDAAKFLGGCALTFLGVWFITAGRSDDSGDEEEDTISEEEDAVNLVDHEAVQSESRRRGSDSAKSAPVTRRTTAADRLPSAQHTATPERPPALLVTPEMRPGVENGAPPLELGQPWQLTPGPANRSAIHYSTTAELPPSTSEPQKPPMMHATTSAPVVPTFDHPADSSLRPRTPMRKSHAGPASPARHQDLSPSPSRRHQPGLQPLEAPPRLINRHSIVGLLPGPLTSPLSSSLTAIVADSLRRGVDHTPPSTLRRKSLRSARRRTGGGGDDARSRRESAAPLLTPPANNDESDPAAQEDGAPDTGGAEPAPATPDRRSRRFSLTVADIFGSAPKRRRSGDVGGGGG